MAQSLRFKEFLRMLISQGNSPEGDFSRSRRNFLRGSAATTGALALAGCSTFDRWMMGDSNRLDKEVMVLGGGLAGLTAAYQLKKNKIPYKVYEASSRLGGRMQTLREFNSDHQFAEAGAEFFEGHHKNVLQLCKELNLSIQDISYEAKKERALYWLNDKIVDEKEFRQRLKVLASNLAKIRQDFFANLPADPTPAALLVHPRLMEFDGRSLADFLISQRGVVEDPVLDAFETLCVSEWGVDAKRINFLLFLLRMDFEERALSTNPGKIYRVEGGNACMIDVLGARVAGVLPDLILKMNHRLTSIHRRSTGYECSFETPQGVDKIWARQIICTLPWSLLKEVEGLADLEIGSNKRAFVQKAQYATHSKVISSFKEPPWKKASKNLPTHQSIFRGQLVGQNYWDSSRGQPGTHGLISSQRGGERGLNTGASAPIETLQDLRHFYKDLPSEENSEVFNWSQKPFAKGSRLNIEPGDYASFLAALIEEDGSSFYMAGEHMSFREGASMNGAMETALVAAERAQEKSFLKT